MLSSFSVPSDVAEEYANSVVILWAIHQCCFHRNKSLRFSKCGSTWVHSSKILLNSGTWLSIVVLTTLWPQTFFSLYIFFLLSHPTLLPLCRKNMKYLSGHNFYMVMLLAFEITLCNGGQNKLSVETVFMFLPTEWHKYVFLLTFAVRWIWFLWRRSFTSGWFKMQLLSSQRGI